MSCTCEINYEEILKHLGGNCFSPDVPHVRINLVFLAKRNDSISSILAPLMKANLSLKARKKGAELLCYCLFHFMEPEVI